MLECESLQVHNTVLLDEGCALGERDLQTVACVRRSWRSGHKEREESQDSSELHLHCEEKIGGLWTNEVERGSEERNELGEPAARVVAMFRSAQVLYVL